MPQVLILALALAVVAGGYLIFRPEIKTVEEGCIKVVGGVVGISNECKEISDCNFYPEDSEQRDSCFFGVATNKKDEEICKIIARQSQKNGCLENIRQLKQSVVDISDWQTYRNEQYGFEFKYPSNWDFQTPGYYSVTVGNPMSGERTYSFSVRVISNPQNLASKAFVEKIISDSEKSGTRKISYVKEYEIIVGGLNGYELEGVDDLELSAEKIYLSLSNKILEINFPISADNSNLNTPKENNLISHQILSTFNFFPPTSSADTTNWQTYRNEEYGFEFKYPSQFAVTSPQSKRFSTGLVFLKYLGKEGTNGKATVYISAETDPLKINSCLISEGGSGKSAGPVVLTQTTSTSSGIWYLDQSLDYGMSQKYDIKNFITIHNGKCLEFSRLIHTSNLGVYDPGTVMEFDATEINSLFPQIFSTFKFTK